MGVFALILRTHLANMKVLPFGSAVAVVDFLFRTSDREGNMLEPPEGLA
jgi:hypothetical protein